MRTDNFLVLQHLSPKHPALPQVLSLIESAFAYMDGAIDPPSSVHALTLADMQHPGHEVWAIRRSPASS